MTPPPDNSPSPRREAFYIITLLAFAFALRLLAVGLRGAYLGFDESMYIVLGKNLLSGHSYTLNALPNVTFPFAVPLLAGAFYKLTGSPRWAVNLPTALFSTLTLLPVYFIVRHTWGRLTALTAALLYAAFPPFLFLVPYCPYADRLYAGSESIFAFFILSASFAFFRLSSRPSLSVGLALGFFSGIAFQVRQDALGYFLCLSASLYLYLALRDRKPLHLPAAKSLLAAALVFALLAAPFPLWVRHVTGRTSLGPRFPKTFRMRDSFTAVIADSNWDAALHDYFSTNPDRTQLESPYYGVAPYHIERYASGKYDVSSRETLSHLRPRNLPAAFRVFSQKLLPPAAWILILVGLVTAFRERKWPLLLVALSLTLPSVFVTLTLYVLARFYVLVALAALFFAARALDLCATGLLRLAPASLSSSPRRAAALYLALPLVLSLYLASSTLSSARTLRHDYDDFERRTEMQLEELIPQLDSILPPSSRLVAFSPVVEARTSATWLALPADSPDNILAYCRNRQADFLLVRDSDGFFLHYSPADFLPLLEPSRVAFDSTLSGERFTLFDLR